MYNFFPFKWKYGILHSASPIGIYDYAKERKSNKVYEKCAWYVCILHCLIVQAEVWREKNCKPFNNMHRRRIYPNYLKLFTVKSEGAPSVNSCLILQLVSIAWTSQQSIYLVLGGSVIGWPVLHNGFILTAYCSAVYLETLL